MPYPLFHPRRSGPRPLSISKETFRQELGTENGHVEWKTGAGGKPLQEAAVAFSNADGGVIVIGVGDDGEVVGRETTPGLIDDIHRILREVHNPGSYEIHPLDVEGTTVTVLAIARRVQGVAQTSDGRVLVARGTRKDALFGADLQRLLNERSLGKYDRSPSGAPLSKVSAKRLATIRKAYRWSTTATLPPLLEKRGLLTREDGKDELTIAGALCLLTEPQERLGKAYVEILRYRDSSESYDRRIQVEGPVDVQVREAAKLVYDELGSELVVLGVHRHQLPRVPLRVLREAIANAVAHRSYEQSGQSVRIEIRTDAVTIVSPGGLPEPVTAQNIRDTQAARNSAVIDVLRRFGLAEDAGMGIDVIEDVMRDELLEPPRFHDSGHAVEVTLPVRSPVTPSERAWVREVQHRGAILPADRILVVHAARGELLTNSKARDLLATDALSARAALRRLCDAGFLRQEGTRNSTTYALDESLAPPAGLRMTAAELQERVLDLATEEGSITNSLVRQRFGLERVEALRLLDKLVQSGRLRRLGQRRGTRYVKAA
jgi:ATP-dependent DNA helicase RecG